MLANPRAKLARRRFLARAIAPRVKAIRRARSSGTLFALLLLANTKLGRQHEGRTLIDRTRTLTPAVFLDRDGTIIVDKHYAHDPKGIELIDGAVEGLRMLQDAGYRLFVITNQSGVARGYFDEEDVRAMHDRLDRMLRRRGVRMDRYFYCPHHPDGVVDGYAFICLCRKPSPGMIWLANDDQSLDLARSWVVGDAPCDVLAGVRAGCKTILLDGPRNEETHLSVPIDYHAQDLRDAAAFIVQQPDLARHGQAPGATRATHPEYRAAAAARGGRRIGR